VLSGNSFNTIEPAGAIASQARGINSRGDIVGDFRGSNNVVHAFLLCKATFTVTDVPGAYSHATEVSMPGMTSLEAMTTARATRTVSKRQGNPSNRASFMVAVICRNKQDAVFVVLAHHRLII
jgi:hypothetical protein